MRTNLIARLNHMRDLGPSEAEVNLGVSARISNVLTEGGFERLDTPVLEPTDLFVRKSGGEVSSSLYSFQDPGGMSVSLRPEFTPSIIRWFIENVPKTRECHRYHYSGPVFRYAGPYRARFRQFQQVGAELIGVSDDNGDNGDNGDAEILKTAIRCLRGVGLGRFTLKLGHIGMILDIVESQRLSEQVKMFIVSNVGEICASSDYVERLTESAVAAGLVTQDSGAAPTAGFDTAMPELEALRRSMSGQGGRRSAERIMARLAMRMKRSSSRADFIAALENVSQLVSLKGPARQVAENAEAVLKSNGATLSSARGLARTLRDLESDGVSESAIHLDLSYVRGLTYYTGIVFEFLDGAGAGGYPVGGGGRYDGLVRAFGGNDVPACGFALYVDEVARAIQQRREESR